ncbi:MAG: hypothetical protein KA116_06530 [Proteobacteria bacterium]|nr:hypothetical protein [Pseudomonadota bacterium]
MLLFNNTLSLAKKQIPLCEKAFSTLVKQEAFVDFSDKEISLLEDYRSAAIKNNNSRWPNPQIIKYKGRDYRVIEILGAGGHGKVYHVVDNDGQEFTLKVFRSRGGPSLENAEQKGIPSVAIRGETHELLPEIKIEKYHFVHGLSIEEINRNLDLHNELREKILFAFEK